MFPKAHILLGFVFTLVLFLLFPNLSLIQLSIVFLSSFLIDFDHYLYYCFVKKSINPFKAYRWFVERTYYVMRLSREERNKHKGVFLLFHGLEFFLVLTIFGKFVHPYFYFILIGVLFHIFLDLIYQRVHHDRWDKVSIIHDFFKFKKLQDSYGKR